MFRFHLAARWTAQRLGPGKKLIEPVKVQGEILDADHARNFLDCVKSRKTCNCDIETGHRSTSATLLGNIALRSNSVLSGTPLRNESPTIPKPTICCLTATARPGDWRNSQFPLNKGGQRFRRNREGVVGTSGLRNPPRQPPGPAALAPFAKGEI